MYGLPKIHRENCPMRPVVSCVDTPTYFLAKTFMDILNQALPKPSSFIKNSFEVTSKIQNLVVPDTLCFY